MDERGPEAEYPGLEAQAAQARAGDRAALEFVVRAVHADVYNMALRFLWHPQDAQDATQEILIRVITGLGTFAGESSFRTWVYRVACNRLLSLKRQRMEQQAMSFDEFGADLESGLAEAGISSPEEPEAALLLQEVRIGCTLFMLMCLDRPHRLAYILGEILELEHHDAAAALEIEPAAFRKRLSRARASITSFMAERCGLIESKNACRCERRVVTAIGLGRVDPAKLLFASAADQARHFPQVLTEIQRLDAGRRAAALYRSHPRQAPSGSFETWLRGMVGNEFRGAPSQSTE